MVAARRRAAVLALVPLVYLVHLYGLDRYGLVNGDEGFYHAVAVAMVETGDYLRLDFHGEHRLYDRADPLSGLNRRVEFSEAEGISVR